MEDMQSARTETHTCPHTGNVLHSTHLRTWTRGTDTVRVWLLVETDAYTGETYMCYECSIHRTGQPVGHSYDTSHSVLACMLAAIRRWDRTLEGM